MPSFSKKSRSKLWTCHPEIIAVFSVVILQYDCAIIEGHREEKAQNAAYDAGNSQLRWPHGNHNAIPSNAVDAVPWLLEEPHIDWEDMTSWYELEGIVKAAANRIGVKLIWGGDWRMRDMPHWELDKRDEIVKITSTV